MKKTLSSRSPQKLLWLLGLAAAGAYLLFRSRANAAIPSLPPSQQPTALLPAPTTGLPIQAGTQNIPELPATMAPTQPQIQASGSFWDNLLPVQGLSSGYVNFPSGAQAAAALFPMRMDANGNYYVQWSGLVYVLGNQDSSGNWPAQAIG
jgi:hypothetical protein